MTTAADSKQLHTAHAAAAGLMAASLARDGFTGAQQILEGPQGLASGMSSDADPARLVDGLGTRWALAETFSGGANEAEMRDAIGTLWRMATLAKVGPLLGARA
jgi:2-methylcitrate dehydratase PrpD